MKKTVFLHNFFILYICEFLGSISRQYSKYANIDLGYALFNGLISSIAMFCILKLIFFVLGRNQKSKIHKSELKSWHLILTLIPLVLLLVLYPSMIFNLAGIGIVIYRMVKEISY